MGCLMGSGVIFTRGLGGGVSLASTEKNIKTVLGLIFEFNFLFDI